MTYYRMIVKRELGEKGQVVIPKDIRTLLGIREKGTVIFEVSGNEVKLKPEQTSEEFMKKFLQYRKKGKSPTTQELKKLEEESYDLP